MRYTVKHSIMSKLQGVSKMTQTNTPHMTDYEAERRNFHLDVPAQFNFAIDVIGKWATDPNKLAMLWISQIGEEKHLTFAYFSATPRWYYIRRPAIPSVTPSQVNTGLTSTRMICTGSSPKWVVQATQ